MKKIFFIGLFTVSFFSAHAQTWFDVGLKGGMGAGFTINKVVNSDSRFDLLPQMNYFYGGKLGVNFGEKIGFDIDIDYGTYAYGFSQAKIVNQNQSLTYTYKIGFNAMSFMPTFRYTNEASYLEIGFQYSILKNQWVDDGVNSGYLINRVASNSKQLVFGFGGHMVGNDVIALMMGLRFSYAVSDLTAPDYLSSNFPFTNYQDIIGHTPTNRLNTQLVIELNYSLGYLVRASCGRRTAFLSF
ncbi:MAG TPA: hypothetical protein EYG85_07725 [Crocinitomix sp.]|nr:hypothetical protein [Crocinitomix sp.]